MVQDWLAGVLVGLVALAGPSSDVVGMAPGSRTQSAKPPPSPRNAVPIIATTPSIAWQRDMLASVNDVRRAAGCQPLVLDPSLTAAAEAQARLMASRSTLSHDLSPLDLGGRVQAAGYNWSDVAENIAAGQSSVPAVMASWTRSPEHRANIANCAFTSAGFGYVEHRNDPGHTSRMAMRFYWAQIFARSLDEPPYEGIQPGGQ